MIDRIQIKGYKSIREMDLELRPLNILIGANGAGKSNFLSVFEFLRYAPTDEVHLYVKTKGGANRFLYFGAKQTHELRVDLCRDNNMYGTRGRFSSGDSLTLIGDYSLKSVSEGFRVYHFHDTTDTARIKLTNNIYDNYEFYSDGANLAAYLYMLRETQSNYYDLIVKTIRIVAPFFTDFVLRPVSVNPETILLQWRENNYNEVLNASYLSDGTLRFMALTTLFLQPNLPNPIIVDEPELGLHPQAIRVLAGMLKSAAAKTQVIVSTQSVTLINQFEPEAIIVVDKKDGQSSFKRLDSEGLSYWLEEYSMGEIWEKNIVGGNPQR